VKRAEEQKKGKKRRPSFKSDNIHLEKKAQPLRKKPSQRKARDPAEQKTEETEKKPALGSHLINRNGNKSQKINTEKKTTCGDIGHKERGQDVQTYSRQSPRPKTSAKTRKTDWKTKKDVTLKRACPTLKDSGTGKNAIKKRDGGFNKYQLKNRGSKGKSRVPALRRWIGEGGKHNKGAKVINVRDLKKKDLRTREGG